MLFLPPPPPSLPVLLLLLSLNLSLLDLIQIRLTKLTLKIENVTGFRETLRADIDHGRFQPPGHRSQNMNIVIVSHGLTLRVFLMRWYKWTVEQFEGLNNLGNGGIIVMEKGYGGRYSKFIHP